MTRRLLQLYLGLALYGFSLALMVLAGLGLAPWDVLHQGIAERTPLSIGTVLIIVGALVLLAWIPLRERPGVGTVSNVIVVGLAMDASLAVLPDLDSLGVRIPVLLAGVVLNAVATAAYVGARLGSGPRDGLMTGLVRVTGQSVGRIRTAIEVVVLSTGWLLGGTVGIGTLLYAFGIGPMVHVLLPLMTAPTGGLSPGAPPLPRDVPGD